MKMTELPAHQLVIHQTFVLQKHTVLKESEICTALRYRQIFRYIFSLFWHLCQLSYMPCSFFWSLQWVCTHSSDCQPNEYSSNNISDY